ncbi:IS110 family RNA-guided transposase [Dyella flagellata]|uniref:IS110 family transposase n=1 Tax=Dyella flagellata TaxID=1867833 RepID=A0ABQ5X6L2_9GAMM|nr:IS110 family transposase [Dyella flagellata]GLQ86844.1 IS110 family transposase [Dyella flagellata]
MNKRTPTAEASELAIDLAKNVFDIVAADRQGRELWHRSIRSRRAFESFLDKLRAPLCVGMEAGPGVQAWGRRLQGNGIEVKILPARAVKAHAHRMKNDLNDARAILRAMRDSDIHPVPVKTREQLALQMQHRVRAGWVNRRTAACNQLRGLLLEQGLVAGRSWAALKALVDRVLRGEWSLPEGVVDVVEACASEWQSLSARIEAATARLARLAHTDETAQRLCTIPGIGPITATAVVGKGLDPTQFKNSRRCGAYLGIVPEQHGTGGRVVLGKMSRRGDAYLRTLFIEGALSVVRQARRRKDATDVLTCRIRRWMERHGVKGAAVRLANHNVRVVWALLEHGGTYQVSASHASMTL